MKRILVLLFIILSTLFIIGCSEKQDVHEHQFEDKWSYNDSCHYYKSTCEHDIVKNLEEHSFTSYIYNNDLKKYIRTCTICGYKQEMDVNSDKAYHYDDNFHYHLDEMGNKTDIEAHEYSEYEIIIDASVENSGLKERHCMTCGYSDKVKIDKLEVKRIPKLEKGDTIALIAPASPNSSDSTYLNAKAKLESYGFKVKIYDSVINGKNYSVSYLALSEEARASEINDAFADKEVKGIICIRGGYGSSRTLELLDYDLIRENPKFFTGYSDITALINAFYYKSGIISYQGFMGLTLAKSSLDNTTKTDIEELLLHNNANREFKYGTYISNCKDTVRGTLIGGNLSLFVHLLGSEYLPNCKDKIIFLEDTGEATYSVDRMMTKLRLFNVFRECKGVVLGYFTSDSDKAAIETMLKRELKDLDSPVLYGFPSGHEYPFISLPIGTEVELSPSGLKVIGEVFE